MDAIDARGLTMRMMGNHPHLEDAYALSMSELLALHARGTRSLHLIASRPGEALVVAVTLELAEAVGVARLSYVTNVSGTKAQIADSIELEATCPHYGGLRWWFRCPVTGKRASKLYLFPGERRFIHRVGIYPPPTYLSQRVAGSDKVYRRLFALRQSIPGQGSILDPLKRPRGMHLKTYLRLLRRDASIWNSSDNRLLAGIRLLLGNESD